MLILNRRRLLQCGAWATAEYLSNIERVRAHEYGFGAQNAPQCGWWSLGDGPYSRKSPWKTGVGSGAVYDTTSVAATALRGLSPTANILGIHSSGYSQPWWTGTSTDPLIQVTDTSNTGSPYWGRVGNVHIPLGATPSVGTQHMSVVDYAQGLVWHGYECYITDANGNNPSKTNPVVAGCKITYYLGRWCDLYGNGIDAFGLTQSANRYGWGDCEVRNADLAVGGIYHVMRVVISQAIAAVVNSAGWNTQPWPTIMTDYNNGGYAGNIPFGILKAIPPSVNIASLLDVNGNSFNANQIMFARAAQDFGLIERDTTGLGGANNNLPQFVVNCEPAMVSANPQALTDFANAMPTIVANLAIITNYSQSTYPYAGGGIPRAMCPPAGPWDL